MKSMLSEGIGVHHSGILPILKEIVERCFACKLVKLLFATETFAMGVNMPARTVLFDSIRKFDGQAQRTLQPAEFIQMAGRAGRRNEESVGTVLIICKKVPEIGELKTMMLGTPEKLKSQFRLTYSMILRLLRVETISVEYMMSRSFMEYYEQSQHVRYLKDIELTESKIAKLGALANQGGYAAHFSDLYDAASDYLDLLRDTKADARVMRDLFPGRILLICHKSHVNKLALLLKVECHRDLVDLIVLVLCNDEDLDFSSSNEIKLTVKPDLKQPVKERSNEWYKVLAIINQDKLFAPDASGAHTILTIPITDVIDITTKTLKVKTEIMMNDWNERQIPRFRDRPPGDTFSQTLQELTHLSLSHPDRKGLRFMHWQRNPRLSNREKQDELQEKIKAMKIKSIPNFEELFESVFEWKELERDLERLKFLQSDQSMALYGDYQNKVQVLRKLGYIDKNNAVDMKGRVAIKIRNHELLITELVLGNVLTNMPPEEIAALLSCMVFQQKVTKEPTLNHSLKKGVKIIKETNESIRLTERECGVQPSVDWMELNFNLVEVVYKWATDERFADIMKITEVQEGIIVRCIQQLNDILCDVKLAASIVGDTMLGDKMEEASRRIKREIVFAASLYTTDDI